MMYQKHNIFSTEEMMGKTFLHFWIQEIMHGITKVQLWQFYCHQPILFVKRVRYSLFMYLSNTIV